jgi:hypothetical protein
LAISRVRATGRWWWTHVIFFYSFQRLNL